MTAVCLTYSSLQNLLISVFIASLYFILFVCLLILSGVQTLATGAAANIRRPMARGGQDGQGGLSGEDTQLEH